MPKLYFGKISSLYPQQFDKNFYAAGEQNGTWYGGMQPGDFVFPIFNQAVSKLWRVREYSNASNEINPQGSVQFDVVKVFDPIPISTAFARYRFFVIDINIVNRLTKSTANLETGFFAINLEDGLARMFFSNHQPGLSDGTKITYSFLVPINQLFETFIGMVLQEFNGGNLQYLFKGNQRFLLNSDSEQSMELKPDFSVKVGERTICILDAKYKCPWHKGAVTLSQHDVYQICTYATAYGADQVFLIYPAFKGAKESGAVIGDYKMDLYQRPIRLFAIQVDVTSESLENIKMTMRASIESVIDAMEYPKQKLEIEGILR